jgi:hypothetical protein
MRISCLFVRALLRSHASSNVDRITFALSIVRGLLVTNATMAFTRNPVHIVSRSDGTSPPRHRQLIWQRQGSGLDE